MDLRSTLHALIRIPGTLQLANVNDLADVIRIVGADIAYGACPFGDLLVISCFYKLLKVAHDLVELFDDVGPLFLIEPVEGFFIVSVEVVVLDSAKGYSDCAGSRTASGRRVALKSECLWEGCQFACSAVKVFDGRIDRNEPFGFVVSGTQLVVARGSAL